MGGAGDGGSAVIVPNTVTVLRTLQTPRLVVPSKPAVVSLSGPADPSVTQRHVNMSNPVHLPVTATSETRTTQQLRPLVKPVRVLRIRLLHLHVGRLPAPKQLDLSVHTVCVEHKLAGI